MASREEILRKYGLDASGNISSTTAKPKTKRESILSKYGMDSSGNVVQQRKPSYGWNMGQTASKEEVKPKPVAQAIVQGESNVGGTFLGGYKVTPQKEKREYTAEDYIAYMKQLEEEEKRQQYLETLNLDAQQQKIDAVQSKVNGATKLNIHAFGAYDVNNQTDDERELAQLRQDYNMAESIQYDMKGKEVLDALDEETRQLVEDFTTGSRVEGMNGWAAEKALLEKGYTEEEILQFADYRSRQINKEKMDAAVQKSVDFANSGAGSEFVGSVWSVPQNLTGGVTGSLSLGLQNLQNWISGSDRPVDYNAAAFRGTKKAAAFREQVAQNIYERADTEVGGEINAFLYQTGMSMADSAAVYGMSLMGVPAWAGTAMLSSSAAVNGALEAKERGATDEQALAVGIFSGAAEFVFERVSLDNLLKATPAVGTIRQQVTQMLKNAGMQAGVEGSEEVFTSIANTITDAIIMGDLSALETSIREYMEQGMTETEAKKKAYGDLAKQLALDFVGGALSGGIMGGVAGNINELAMNKATGEMYGENIEDLTAEALEINPESEAAKRVQEKYGAGKKISGGEVRELVLENQKAIDKAVKEEALAEQQRRNAPPTAKVDGKLITAEGNKISAYTSDENGNAFWVTENGTVKGEDKNTESVMGVANKWGGDIGRVIVEQYNGMDEATYSSAADVFVELGIQSADGDMTWEKAAEITGAFVDEVGLEQAHALYSAGMGVARSPAFRSYYHAGLLGNEMGSVSVQGKSWLSDAVKQYAYELGQAHAKDEKRHKYVVSKKAGFDATYAMRDDAGATAAKNLSNNTRKMLDRIGKALGVEIRFATESDKLSDDANGFYNAATGTIVISPNAANPTMVVVAHEVTHRLQDMDFGAYKKYRSFVIGKMEGRTGTDAVTKIRDRYRAFYGSNSFSDLQAMDELVADYTLAMIENGTLFRDLAQGHRSIAKRMLDALKRVIDRLTGKEQYTLYGTTVKEMREAQRLWERMLEGEGTVWDAVTGTRQQGKTVETTQESEYTGSTEAGAPEAKLSLKNGRRAQRGRSIEIETMENNRFSRLRQFRGELPSEWYAFTRDKFYIYSNHSYTDYTILATVKITESNREDIDRFTEELKNGTYGSAEAFDLWTQHFRRGKGRDSWHRISTEDSRNAGRNDGVDVQTQRSNGVRNSEKNGRAGEVKLSLKDSDGNQLSEAQAAYFAESKSVDAQGNLRVMYRGGNSDFTVFDRKKSSYANLYGRGFYFTDSKSHAEQYGGARAFYLNITNPVPTDETTITKKQLLAFLRAVAENEDDYSFENYGYGATPESVVDAIYSGKSDFAMLYDVSQTAIGDMVEAVELFNEINGTDFDGLILDTETVTFRSEQAKLTSNKTPTDDPDIRFSLVTEEQAKKNNKTALEYFGRTYKWSETGYILLDGSRLDFSGKHEGAPGGYRTVDHRDIRDAFGDDYGGNGYSDSLVQFMREGNIRIMPESSGINLSVMPTKAQERALDDFISKERGEVVLDLDDDRGNTVASVEYPRGTRASKVLADIRKYFEDGTMPQVSELAQFRYSLKSDAAMGRTLRDMAEAEAATQKAVKTWIQDVHRGKKIEVSYKEAERVARKLMSDYRSTADAYDVTGAVLDLFNYMQNGDSNRNMKEDVVQEKAQAVAAALLSSEMRGTYYTADYEQTAYGFEMNDMAQDNEELRAFLRDTKIVYPKEYVSDLGTETWTSFNEGLKGARARLSDENNRANVDTLYREDLSRMWPAYFPDDITGEAAMMKRIAEVSQRVFEREQKQRDTSNEAMITRLAAADVLDRFFALPQVGKTYMSVRNLWERTSDLKKLHQNMLQSKRPTSLATIIRQVKALDRKLRDNTEKHHIPDELRQPVLELCSMFTQNTSVFDKYRLAAIKMDYDALADSDLTPYYDEDVSDMLEEMARVLNGRRLSELKPYELVLVGNVVDHFTHMVNSGNEAFVNGKKQQITAMAEAVLSKAATDKPAKSLNKEELDAFERFFTTGNVKPLYLFRRLGGELQRLFEDVLRGQSRYGLLMDAANTFRENVERKYGADKWLNSKSKMEMTTTHGDDIQLSVREAMSLIALYKREMLNKEQDAGHLSKGGIVYENEMKRTIKNSKSGKEMLSRADAGAKPISYEDMLEISRWLREKVSANAEAFIDEMVGYLSTEMAELGNETSMALSGFRKYMEGYYFPYSVAKQYTETNISKQKDSRGARRSPGFSKRTVKKADAPIVLRDFMDVWSEHVSEMLTYSTIAVPQDNLLRVLNYKDVQVDEEDSTKINRSVKVAIQNTYGKHALEYIEQLLRDMNGDIMRDPRDGAASKLISVMKKNAVGLSLSVAIQQPSSVFRAMAHIDPKYFFSVSRDGNYKEMKKYSGVAVIKEIGGFDTNTGRGGARWLKGDEDVRSVVNDAIGFLPQKMDQMTWTYLWNVVKAETRDKYPDLLDNGQETEAFLKAAGERFDEVAELTQVYDSVLTRTENMRAKGLTSLLVTFMSEPMVTLNMAADAIRSGDKKLRKRVPAALFVSIVLNNLLKALVTGARDDDEDQSYIEKWLEKFTGYMVADVLPTSYIPVVKDIMDVVHGYSSSVELYEPLEDLFTKAGDAIENIQDYGASEVFSEETLDFLLALPAVVGVPLDNVKRDVVALINVFAKSARLDETTREGLVRAAKEGFGKEQSLKETLRDGWKHRNNERQRKKALEEINDLYNEKVRKKTAQGMKLDEARKKAASEVKTACTNYLKPIYQSKTGVAKNEVKQFALRIGVGGKQLYAGYDFSAWDE